ncbi:glycoside hydrolase family protein [Prosthecomicrobium pneumaticum]|uniref:Lysozyme n=1 Tax=Prosthecomicrobium pneumaticum TaxID=81895 RepID=A0A7W9FPD1_9HYPH|nr:GH24 family phage-related lysozyme (muramidase) [Prosthecomicrobium pneumaticum]
MRTSERGRAAIAAFEGLALSAYRCPAGRWTIGYGHTGAAGPPAVSAGMRVTAAEAEAILAADLARFEARVTAALGAVPQAVFDGAVSFDFNCGAIDRASWVKAYRAGDAAAAEAGLKQWVKADGRTLAGLVRRRAVEADMIFRGRYPADAAAAPDAAPAAAAGPADSSAPVRDATAAGLAAAGAGAAVAGGGGSAGLVALIAAGILAGLGLALAFRHRAALLAWFRTLKETL